MLYTSTKKHANEMGASCWYLCLKKSVTTFGEGCMCMCGVMELRLCCCWFSYQWLTRPGDETVAVPSMCVKVYAYNFTLLYPLTRSSSNLLVTKALLIYKHVTLVTLCAPMSHRCFIYVFERDMVGCFFQVFCDRRCYCYWCMFSVIVTWRVILNTYPLAHVSIIK